MRKHKPKKSILYSLYNQPAGRCLLKALTAPALSRFAGRFLDTSASKVLIDPFVKHNGIDLSDYESGPFPSFNAFFTRRLAEGKRVIDRTPSHLIAPCDGLLSVYPIHNGTVCPIKGVDYSIRSLLRSRILAKKFEGGLCLVFRLCVDHYHRYAFFDDGALLRRYAINGVLHTVRPVALEAKPVFVENSREVSLMRSDNFGFSAQIEVGAMLVGRIVNRENVDGFVRGEEKGRFEYGGSTVVLLLTKDAAKLDKRFVFGGTEIPVRFGEQIGEAHAH